jgi:hypothetical protein
VRAGSLDVVLWQTCGYPKLYASIATVNFISDGEPRPEIDPWAHVRD